MMLARGDAVRLRRSSAVAQRERTCVRASNNRIELQKPIAHHRALPTVEPLTLSMG